MIFVIISGLSMMGTNLPYNRFEHFVGIACASDFSQERIKFQRINPF
jgi:hypothetical protein